MIRLCLILTFWSIIQGCACNETEAVFMGCYEDGSSRTLNGLPFVSRYGMTTRACVEYCRNHRFTMAGLETGQECHCGNKMNTMVMKPLPECNTICTGDPSRVCGGLWRLSVYSTGYIGD